MEQHHTPSPSIASLLNPIQPYHNDHSPSPTLKKANIHNQSGNSNNKRPSKRAKIQRSPSRDNHHHQIYNTAQEPNQSILFNLNPSIHSSQQINPSSTQNLVENQTPNNSFNYHHQLPINYQNQESSRQSSSSSSTTTVNAPSTNIETNLEHSIFGIAPYDQFTWTIAQFIWQHARPYWESGQAKLIEVEAKLGTIRDKRNQGERMYYPIGTESPILDTRETKFQSDMSIKQHESLNRLLNQRVTESNSNGYPGAKVNYLHVRTIDEFYDSQVRVSRDWKGGKGNQSIPRCIVKEKIAHLDIHCPGRPFDFRISVNVEQPASLPPENVAAKFQRIKDRLSYSHQVCQIDLTQVKTAEQNGPSTHEVEVEFRNSEELLKAAHLWSKAQDSNNIDQQEKSETSEQFEGLFGDEEEEDEDDSENEEMMQQEERAGSRPNAGNGVKERKKQSNHVTMDSNYYLLMVEVFLNNIRMMILNC